MSLDKEAALFPYILCIFVMIEFVQNINAM